MDNKEALESLRRSAEDGDCSSEAVKTVEAAIAQLRSLASRMIDAGVTTWHTPDKECALVDWLELTEQEYADWMHKTGTFSSDSTPYRLDDDQAIMKGYHAIKNMLVLRIGSQADHAQAFRDAISD